MEIIFALLFFAGVGLMAWSAVLHVLIFLGIVRDDKKNKP